MIILDVPSPSHIASLLDTFARSPFYRKFQSSNPKYITQSIFHLCGENVLADKRYVEFMNKFPADTNVSTPYLEGRGLNIYSRSI